MGILTWIVLGGIVGAIAKLIMPGKDPGGIIVTILLGIAGAFVGGYISTLLGFGSVTGFNIVSLAIAVVGALILLALYRMIKK
ncbi:MAG: GlsB/YeaQ/YmgE family stress response membrane protein [Pseudomonadota bacterium]